MNTANQFKVGDLITFTYCVAKRPKLRFADRNLPLSVEVTRKSYARRVIKVGLGVVEVNLNGKRTAIDVGHVRKIWP